MSVNIIWSTSNGGSAISGLVDHGNSSNGLATTEEIIYVRHDGGNVITNAGYYLRALSTSYTGGATANADIAELLAWADSAVEADFGGVVIDQAATTSFDSILPVYSDSKTAARETGDIFRTGNGDSESNLIDVLTESGLTGSPAADGVIQVGSSPNVRFELRIQVPTSEDTLGIRQWDQVLSYSYTS